METPSSSEQQQQLIFDEDEEVVVIPDLTTPSEEIVRVKEDFLEFFADSLFKSHILTQKIIARRGDVERRHNRWRTNLRQIVAQVAVFTIPDDVYANAQNFGKNHNHDAFVFNLVLEHATLLATSKLKSGGEPRLHGTLAAAFGGHMQAGDLPPTNLLPNLVFRRSIFRAAMRELNEELAFDDYLGNYDGQHTKPYGVINSAAGEMESVHIGFLHVLAMPESMKPRVKETNKLRLCRIPLKQLADVWLKGECLLPAETSPQPVVLDNWTKMVFLEPRAELAHAIILSARG